MFRRALFSTSPSAFNIIYALLKCLQLQYSHVAVQRVEVSYSIASQTAAVREEYNKSFAEDAATRRNGC